jgi:acyl-coenzyme A synthetase/AMP-(fatty) acid ligase
VASRAPERDATEACTPLLARAPSDALAIRRGALVTAAEFLSQAQGLAQTLPATGCVINVCEDRYRFLVGFVAALARGLTTLMPPNTLEATLSRIRADWPDSVVMSDAAGTRAGVPVIAADDSRRGPPTIPLVADRLLAAVTFTSGSTGAPAPQFKSWRALVRGTALNLPHFLGTAPGPYAVVSTVPAQHMYGFETTALAALRGPATMHDGRPFFPANVAAALAESPAPRVLVSTPVHLRALVASGTRFAPLARVLSATAPLDPALAAEVEDRFGAELVEIYGCTEVGSMASRRTATGERWRFFDGIRCEVRDGVARVSGAHIDGSVPLLDALEFGTDGGFALTGRDSDLVKIGGKRASLAEVTRQLLAVRGVEDAVAFQLPGAADEARLVALVVARSLDAAAVRAALVPVLDPVFIPRPIVLVPALPRSASGKLAREAVVQLYRETAGSGATA